MIKKKFDGSISEIMVAYKPNGDLDFEPVKKWWSSRWRTTSTACLWAAFPPRLIS